MSNEPGWLSGEIRGHVGWFPEAYVEKMDQPNWGENGELAAGSVDGTMSSAKRQQLEGIQELPENVSDNGSITEAVANAYAAAEANQSAFIAVASKTGDSSPVLGQVSHVKVPRTFRLLMSSLKGQLVDNVRAEALHAWRGIKGNHLSFNKGDVIFVREQQEHWWFGQIDEQSGWFPKSCVNVLEAESASLASVAKVSPIGAPGENIQET